MEGDLGDGGSPREPGVSLFARVMSRVTGVDGISSTTIAGIPRINGVRNKSIIHSNIRSTNHSCLDVLDGVFLLVRYGNDGAARPF